jgi:hypothetical protein
MKVGLSGSTDTQMTLIKTADQTGQNPTHSKQKQNENERDRSDESLITFEGKKKDMRLDTQNAKGRTINDSHGDQHDEQLHICDDHARQTGRLEDAINAISAHFESHHAFER